MTYILPEKLRAHLKKPLGRLVGDIADIEFPETVICIGDKTCEVVLGRGIKPKLLVYDGVIMRKRTGVPDAVKKFDALETKVGNPAGSITDEAILAIEKALESGENAKLLIDGEEDLLVLPAALYAPVGSMVLYGQPKDGLVAVTINKDIKYKVEYILHRMEQKCGKKS